MATKITQNAKIKIRQSLKNKKILITAGPTWVKIDSVRVISNIATGETGILLAREASRLGAKVTLILGPGKDYSISDKPVTISRFNFFNELRSKVKNELHSKRYDIFIHSAAVSDFKPQQPAKGKLRSGRAYDLKLSPLPKIIKDINPAILPARTVIFKLESAISDKILIQRAKAALASTGAEFVVANRLNPYRAFIINKAKKVVPIISKKELAKKLLKILCLNN